jgi:hypothetical protein
MDTTMLIRIVSGLIVVVGCFIPMWKIYSKAGFSPWLLLLWLIPIAGPLIGIGIMYMVAFSKWKVKPEDLRPSAPSPTASVTSA